MKLNSLRAKLTASFASLAGVFAAFALFFFPDTALRYAEQLELARAQSLARTLAKAALSALDFADDLAMRDLVDSIGDEPDGRFSAIIAADGRKLQTFTADPKQKVDFDRYVAAVKKGQMVIDSQDLLVLAHPIKGNVGNGGFFLLGISRDTISVMRTSIHSLTIVFAVLIVAAASALGWGLGSVIARPAVKLAQVSRAIVSSGDLTLAIDATSNDEIGDIADTFRELLAWQRELLSGVDSLSASVEGTSEKLERAGQKLEDMSLAGGRRVDGAQRSADATRATMGALTQRTSDLESAMLGAQHASEHVGSIARVVASKVTEASRVGDENQAALGEVLLRLRQAQTAADALDETVHAGKQTLDEMQSSLSRVRTNVQHAAQAGEMVATQADEGEGAMSRTLDDLDNIRRSSKTASDALAELVTRIDDVTDVVNVIDNVAAQTNLLSLNASIIAAQAGEHGRSFTVVAAEIKTLAANTRDHTQRIADIVANVKRDFSALRQTMQAGVQNAEQGAERGRHTAAAFTNISLAAADSRDRLRSIAHDTEQQADLSVRVAWAIDALTKNVAHFGDEQRAMLAATGQVRNYVEAVVGTTTDVRQASSEQLDATAQIDHAVSQVRTVSRALDEAQKRQVVAHTEMLSALSAMAGFAREQREIASALTHAISELSGHVSALRGSVRRFRV